jgi:hypothetical protein
MFRRLLIAIAALAAVAFATFRLMVEPWWRSWGVVPNDVARPLPGDEIIPDAATSDTRSVTIAAPPETVWPWLVQMGYGRAGWYSYDMVDMSGTSADRIDPALQDLKVGDVMPTHPGGGFLVKLLEPNHALVLYADTELMREQEDAARAAGLEAPSANVRATGALMETAQPVDFTASWAFVLEPMPSGETRLIERFRARFGQSDKPWTRYTLPVMGFGVFVMVRRQLIGIKQLVERGASPAKEAASA